MPRQSLGRGLSALLGEEPGHKFEMQTSLSVSEAEIDIDLIDPNPEQPRTRFVPEMLQELAQSIRANGIIQPIVVRRAGGRYQIVAGERRWRAAQHAELRRVPAVIRDVPDERLLEFALIENIQRQELNPVEEASAYRKLIDTIGLTQEEVADRVGKERSAIATSLRLLRLPQEVRELLETGRLSAGHGRALLLTDDVVLMTTLAEYAAKARWSVRETEKHVRRAMRSGTAEPKEIAGEPRIDPNIKAAETRLMRALNTNVRILPGAKGKTGKIEIEYYSLDDLDRIFQVIYKKEKELG